MEIDSKPAELDDLDRHIAQLKIEQMALKKENDSVSLNRLKEINNELDKLGQQQSELNKKWAKEKNEIQDYKNIKAEMDKSKFELDKAFNEGNYKRASELQYSVIPNLQKKIDEYQA